MRLSRIMNLAAAIGLVALPAGAQVADRLTDKDVKELIEAVDEARDKFEGELDGKVKNNVIRSATGEIDVKATLGDFEQDLEKLKSRFTDKYAASAEVQNVLRRGGDLDAMMKAQPTGIKGANEWDALASQLRRLGAAYSTTFPVPQGAAVRRINDAEAAQAAEAVAEQGELVKKAVNSDKTMAKPDKETLLTETDDLIKQAKLLKSRLSDSKPATADARALVEKITALTKEGRALPPAVLKTVGALRAPLGKLSQAFGIGSSAT